MISCIKVILRLIILNYVLKIQKRIEIDEIVDFLTPNFFFHREKDSDTLEISVDYLEGTTLPLYYVEGCGGIIEMIFL